MRYPTATWLPSPVHHPMRPATRGVVIHWTAGHKAGDLAALTGGKVDVQFYVDKLGEKYQLLDSGSEAWHAFATANDYCLGIETEGSGEPWTPAQFESVVDISAWASKLYGIPVKHVDPHRDWHGFFGHRDLAGIDGNDHQDSVPDGTGWDPFLAAISSALAPHVVAPYQAWKAWKLGEGAFKGKPSDPAKRPPTWLPAVPQSYWDRLEEFVAARH